MRRTHLIATVSIALATILAVTIAAYIFLNQGFGGLNGSLQVEWQRFLSGYSSSQIIQSSDGGYLVVGTNVTVNPNSGVFDSITLVHKTDSSGNVEWTKTIMMENGYDTQLALALETDGGYLLAGTSEIGYRGGGYSMQGCLVKIDLQGNIIWEKAYDYVSSIRAIIVTSDGGYAMAAMLPTIAPSPEMFYLLKVDSLGNKQWHKGNTQNTSPTLSFFGFSGNPQSIFQNGDGGYIITLTENHHGPSPTPIGIIKLDSNGNQLWRKSYFGEGAYYQTYISDSLALPDGYLLVGGVTPQDGQTSGFIFKTDLKGNALWNRTITYRGETSSITSVSMAEGGFMFLGYAVPIPQGPSSETWVAKIDDAGRVNAELAISTGNHRSTPTSLIQTKDGNHMFVGIWNQDSPNYLDQKYWVIKISG